MTSRDAAPPGCYADAKCASSAVGASHEPGVAAPSRVGCEVPDVSWTAAEKIRISRSEVGSAHGNTEIR